MRYAEGTKQMKCKVENSKMHMQLKRAEAQTNKFERVYLLNGNIFHVVILQVQYTFQIQINRNLLQ